MAKGLDYLINLKDGSFSGAKNAKTELQGLDTAIVKVDRNAAGLGSTMAKAGVAIGGALAAIGIKGIADDLTQVRGQFQSFENLLTNQLGPAGKGVFEEIKKEAANTPFEVDKLTESFIKLQGNGFAPTMEKMGLLGDFAASKMKGIDQLAEAVIDAGSGQFERLLEFNVRASRAGDNLTLSHNGIATTMKFSQQNVEAYLLSLGKMPGIMGSMDAMASTYIGKQSNINDQITQFKDKLAQDLAPVLDWYMNAQSQSIVLMQSSVDWLKENKDIIADVATVVGVGAAAYGMYRLTILAAQAPMALMTAYQWALNVAMNANPVGLLITGIGLLAGGMYIAYKRSETFRAGISGIIEVGRLLGDVFMGVGKQILGALTFNPDMFLEGVKQTVKVAQEIAGGGISKAFNKGFDSSIAETRATEKQSAMDKLAAGNKTTLPGKSTVPKGTGAGAESTTLSTNRQVRNVQVSIGKLVENLTVATTNLQGAGSADIKRMITEILTGAVHDSELALSSE